MFAAPHLMRAVGREEDLCVSERCREVMMRRDGGERGKEKGEEGRRRREGLEREGTKSSFADLPIESPNEFGAEAAGDA